MDDSFLNEVDSEDYCYKFEVPFYLKVNDIFKKIVSVFEKYDTSNMKSCRNDIRDLNIDDTFFDEFIIFIKNKKTTDSLLLLLNDFIVQEYGDIKKFEKEYNDFYEIKDIYKDDEIVEYIEESFNSECFGDSFGDFSINYFKIVDFNYDNSSFLVDVCMDYEIEDDQVHMIIDFIQEQCMEFWGKRLLEEEIGGCVVQTWWDGKDEKHPKKYNIKYIGMTGPIEDDLSDYDLDYDTGDELDY